MPDRQVFVLVKLTENGVQNVKNEWGSGIDGPNHIKKYIEQK